MISDYEYLIMGAGMGGLSLAALLANQGKSVCLLDKNSEAGGYAHSFSKGDYQFCHSVQYLMGCNEGEPIDRLLEQLDLQSIVRFNEFNHQCFDLISINESRSASNDIIKKEAKVSIDHHILVFQKKLKIFFPHLQKELDDYFSILHTLFEEMHPYKSLVKKEEIYLSPLKYRHIIKYISYSVEDLFNEFDFPTDLRAILAAQAGNLALNPRDCSLIAYSVMLIGFSKGAHYPAKGMRFFVDHLLEKVKKQGASSFFMHTEVKKINLEKGKIASVLTSKGELRAKHYISNLDPKLTLKLMSSDSVLQKHRKKYSYDYSCSAFSVYLGLKNINLRQHGFGRWNIWHHAQMDIDKEFDDQLKRNDFKSPFVFISTPSLNTNSDVLCPKDKATMELVTTTDYGYFKRLYKNDKRRYNKVKLDLADYLIDIVAEHYLPDIREHIEVQIVQTPVDIHDSMSQPKANIYGPKITPDNYGLNKLNTDSPIANLNFVGAAASYPGVCGVVLGALELFEQLQKKKRKWHFMHMNVELPLEVQADIRTSIN